MLPSRIRFTVSLIAAGVGIGCHSVQAQTPSTSVTDPQWGTWFIGTVVLPAGPKKWGGYAEVQARSNGLFRQYFYNEIKGGVSYDLDKNFTAMIAGGRYSTSDYRDLSDGALNVEKRLWGQLTLSQYRSRLKVEHRYRVEQRWFSFRDDVVPVGSRRHQNRIRYRLNAFLPLNNPTITDKTVFLSVYDEIFLNPRGPVFERNRVYGGVGYQLNPQWTVQAGWLNQANIAVPKLQQSVFVPQTKTIKNNLVFTVMYRIARSSSSETPAEYLPSQQD